MHKCIPNEILVNSVKLENNNMKQEWFFVLTLSSFWLNIGYSASIGQDLCNNCQPIVIRTPKISVPMPGDRIICTKIPGATQYTPISDLCNCVNTRVTPASIAKVDCDLTATTPTPDCGYCNAATEPQPFGQPGGAFNPKQPNQCGGAGGTSSGYPVVQDPPGPNGIDEPATGNECCGDAGPPAVAVDPVSLTLAQAEANRCRGGVPEDRLTFGQTAVPKDALPSSTGTPDVNEEGLYALDKAIVELKTCKRFGQDTAMASDTDALLALEEDAQSSNDASATGPEVNLPSYADAGYQTETPSCAPLIGGVSVPPATNPNAKVIYDATEAPMTSPVVDYSRQYCSASPQQQCSYGKCSNGKCPSCGQYACSCGGKCSYGGKCSCGMYS